jgi:hypothetical protein
MISKMKEKPWPIYKIKLGNPDDIAIVTELRNIQMLFFASMLIAAGLLMKTLNNAIELKKLELNS